MTMKENYMKKMVMYKHKYDDNLQTILNKYIKTIKPQVLVEGPSQCLEEYIQLAQNPSPRARFKISKKKRIRNNMFQSIKQMVDQDKRIFNQLELELINKNVCLNMNVNNVSEMRQNQSPNKYLSPHYKQELSDSNSFDRKQKVNSDKTERIKLKMHLKNNEKKLDNVSLAENKEIFLMNLKDIDKSNMEQFEGDRISNFFDQKKQDQSDENSQKQVNELQSESRQASKHSQKNDRTQMKLISLRKDSSEDIFIKYSQSNHNYMKMSEKKQKLKQQSSSNLFIAINQQDEISEQQKKDNLKQQGKQIYKKRSSLIPKNSNLFSTPLSHRINNLQKQQKAEENITIRSFSPNKRVNKSPFLQPLSISIVDQSLSLKFDDNLIESDKTTSNQIQKNIYELNSPPIHTDNQTLQISGSKRNNLHSNSNRNSQLINAHIQREKTFGSRNKQKYNLLNPTTELPQLNNSQSKSNSVFHQSNNTFDQFNDSISKLNDSSSKYNVPLFQIPSKQINTLVPERNLNLKLRKGLNKPTQQNNSLSDISLNNELASLSDIFQKTKRIHDASFALKGRISGNSTKKTEIRLVFNDVTTVVVSHQL